MLQAFFSVAMIAPGRQITFRRAVVAHSLFLTGCAWIFASAGTSHGLTTFGYIALGMAMVEAAALVGWRLAQMPKSQALEFLLVSPIQPRRLFLAEAFVGLSRYALVWLSGLPLFMGMLVSGMIQSADLLPLFALPFAWGLAIAMGLIAWVYESSAVRRIGEIFGLLSVLAYLTVGVLAGENLVIWLRNLPDSVAQLLYDGVIFLHTMNPFGVVRYWFSSDGVEWIGRERVYWLCGIGFLLTLLFAFRAAYRLPGHFHDRHYQMKRSKNGTSGTEQLFASRNFPFSFAQRPLSWWAVHRVMEYSGRVNLWLAGGFSVLYSAFIVAGDDWPAWMGRLVFQLFEQWGGAPTVAAAMATMAMIPAIFQFGLWDASVQDRCKRLELLLLTDFRGSDYFHASLAAAWRRGRGYLCVAGMLWLALALSGRVSWGSAIAAFAGGLLLWAFGFAVGFRCFSTGYQTSGLATVVALGMPLLLFGCVKAGWENLAGLVPTGSCYLPVSSGVNFGWAAGFALTSAFTVWLMRSGLKYCDTDLRKWYDANQGTRSAG